MGDVAFEGTCRDCGESGHSSCDRPPEAVIAGLRIERDRMVTMLRSLEWAGGDDGRPCCPVCKCADGHYDCTLNALLEEMGR
jgi:hypothetical protein